MGKVDEVFSEMKKNRITPNDFVCGAAISCFKKKGRWNRAVKLLEKMIKDRSIVVTTSTFNTVLSAVCDAGEVDRASDVMNMMRASGATHNSQTYRVFIEALCAAKRLTIAADLLVEMKREGVPCSTDLYVAVVTSLEQKRNYKKALSVYALMTESGVNFYESKVLDAILKRLLNVVNLVNAVDIKDVSVTDLFDL